MQSGMDNREHTTDFNAIAANRRLLIYTQNCLERKVG